MAVSDLRPARPPVMTGLGVIGLPPAGRAGAITSAAGRRCTIVGEDAPLVSLRRSILRLAIGIAGLAIAILPALAQPSSPPPNAQRVRIVTVDFVLPGKLEKIGRLARDAHTELDHLFVETAPGEPENWLDGADLVILDTPRPMDLAKVQQRLGPALSATPTPWVRIGGGPPAFGNIPPQHARRLMSYYAGGGERNLRAMFAYMRAWRAGTDTNAVAPPSPLPATGFYHPAAPTAFDSLDSYLAWGRDRWRSDAPRIAFAVHSGFVSGMETKVIDTLVAESEARGLVPMVFWFNAGDPEAVQKLLMPAKADVLVVATHRRTVRHARPSSSSSTSRCCRPSAIAMAIRKPGPGRRAAWRSISLRHSSPCRKGGAPVIPW
jgi:cobaltochelatase CobN